MLETIAEKRNLAGRIYDDLIDTIRNFYRDFPGDLSGSIGKLISKQKEELLSNEFSLAFIGKYSTGKSTIINSMLSKYILPAGIDQTTAYETRIKYGDKPTVTIFGKSDIPELKEEITIDNIRDTISGYVVDNSSKDSEIIDNIIITVPNESLRNGLVIVDTPGTDSVSDEAKITNRILPKMLAVVYVLRGEGISDFDRKYIPSILKWTNKVKFVINLWPNEEPAKETLQYIRNEIGSEVELVEICAQQALFARDPDGMPKEEADHCAKKYEDHKFSPEEMEKQSNIASLEEGLDKLMSSLKGHGLVQEHYSKIKSHIDGYQKNINELISDNDKDKESLEDNISDLKTIRREYVDNRQEILENFRNEYFSELANSKKKVFGIIHDRVEETKTDINSCVATALNQESIAGNFKGLALNLVIELSELDQWSDKSINSLFRKSKNDLEGLLQSLTQDKHPNLKFSFSEPEIDVRLKVGNKWSWLFLKPIFRRSRAYNIKQARKQACDRLTIFKNEFKAKISEIFKEQGNSILVACEEYLKDIGADQLENYLAQLDRLVEYKEDKNKKEGIRKVLEEHKKKFLELSKKVKQREAELGR